MIRVNLRKLQDKLSLMRGEKVLLKEIAEHSRVERNALSRLNQHPEIVPSSSVIDKLAQYFFLEFKAAIQQKRGPKWINGWRERRLMEGVISDLISVYPDYVEADERRTDYWKSLPDELRDAPATIPLDTLWSMYERIASAHLSDRFKDPLTGKTMSDLAIKLRSAKNSLTTEGVQIKLSEDEFNLLYEQLPGFEQPEAEEPKKLSSPSKVKKTR